MYIGLDHHYCMMCIKIFLVEIHLGKVKTVFNFSSKWLEVKEIKEQFKGEYMIFVVTETCIFKGISSVLLSFKQLLREYEH